MQDPGQVLREAGVLEVEAAARAAVLGASGIRAVDVITGP